MDTDNSQASTERRPLEELILEAINSGCVIEMANVIRKVMAVNGSIVFSPNNPEHLECIPRDKVLWLTVNAIYQNKSLTQNAKFISMLFRSPLMRAPKYKALKQRQNLSAKLDVLRRAENNYPVQLGRMIHLTYKRRQRASLFALLDIASEMKKEAFSLFSNDRISTITIAYQKLKNAVLHPSSLFPESELQTALLLFLNTDLELFVNYLNDIVSGAISNPYSATQWQKFKKAFLSCPFQVDLTEKKNVNLSSLIKKLHQYQHPSSASASASSSSVISTLSDEDEKRLEQYADEAVSVFQGKKVDENNPNDNNHHQDENHDEDQDHDDDDLDYADNKNKVNTQKGEYLSLQQLKNCQTFILGIENNNAAQVDANLDAEALLTKLDSRFQYYCQQDSEVNGLSEQNYELGMKFYRAQCAIRLQQLFPEHLSIIKTEESYEAAYAVLEHYFSKVPITSTLKLLLPESVKKIMATEENSLKEPGAKEIDKLVLNAIYKSNVDDFKKHFQLFLETSKAGRQLGIDVYSPGAHEGIIKEALREKRQKIVGYLIDHPESLSTLLTIRSNKLSRFSNSAVGQLLVTPDLQVFIAKVLNAHPGRAENSRQYLILLQNVISWLSRSTKTLNDGDGYLLIAEKSFYEQKYASLNPVFQEVVQTIINSIEPLLQMISEKKDLSEQLLLLTQFSLLLMTVDENQQENQCLQRIFQLMTAHSEQLAELKVDESCIPIYNTPFYYSRVYERDKYRAYEKKQRWSCRYRNIFRKLFDVAIQSENENAAKALLNISKAIGTRINPHKHYQVAYQRGKMNEVLFLRSVFPNQPIELLPLLLSLPKMDQIGQFNEQKKFILSLFTAQGIQFECQNNRKAVSNSPIYDGFAYYFQELGRYRSKQIDLKIAEQVVTAIELFLKQNKQINNLSLVFGEVDKYASDYNEPGNRYHYLKVFDLIRDKLKQRLGKEMFAAILSHTKFSTQRHHENIFYRASRDIVGQISIPNFSKIKADLTMLSRMTSHMSPEFIDYAKKYLKLLMLIDKMSSIFTTKSSLYHASLEFINTGDFALGFIAPDKNQTVNGIRTRVYSYCHPCLVFKEFLVTFHESLQQKQEPLTETERTFQTSLIRIMQQQSEYKPRLPEGETRFSIASLASSHQELNAALDESSQRKVQEKKSNQRTVATDSAVSTQSAEDDSDANQKIALTEQQKTELKTFAITWSNQFDKESSNNLTALLVYVECKSTSDQYLFGQQQQQRSQALALMHAADSGSDYTQFMNRNQNMPYGITQTQIPEAKQYFKLCVVARLKRLREDKQFAEDVIELFDGVPGMPEMPEVPEVPTEERASSSETPASEDGIDSARAKEQRQPTKHGPTSC